jgi:hypothetical protein
MIRFIDTLYILLVTTGSYNSIAIPTLYRSLLHTLVSSVCPAPFVLASAV